MKFSWAVQGLNHAFGIQIYQLFITKVVIVAQLCERPRRLDSIYEFNTVNVYFNFSALKNICGGTISDTDAEYSTLYR